MDNRLKESSQPKGTPPSTLPEQLTFWAETRPEQSAFNFITDGDCVMESWTYRALHSRVYQIVSLLEKQSMPGDRVLLIYPSCLEFIAVFMACLCCGRVAVPTYIPRNQTLFTGVQSIVDDARISLVLSDSKTIKQLDQLERANLGQNETWLATDTLGPNISNNKQYPSPQSLAMLQYTSGSTGKPKGVMVSHANLMSNQALIKESFGHGDDTVVVGWLPLFHDMGLIGNILQPLFLGIPCYFMSPESFLRRPVNWLKAISAFGATTSGAPNFAYDLCVSSYERSLKTGNNIEGWKALNLSKWKLAFIGAEPVRAGSLRHFSETFVQHGFSDKAYYPCYGLAESTLIFSGGDCGTGAIETAVSTSDLKRNKITLASNELNNSNANLRSIILSGHTRQSHHFLIVDPDTNTPLPEHRIGEVWIAGDSIAQGYWQKPALNEQVFNAYSTDGQGPFLRTGDLGFRSEGRLAITGRKKDVIVIRGQNYWATDIEETSGTSHPLLRSGYSAAFSLDTDDATQEKAVVVQETKRRGIAPDELEEAREKIMENVALEHGIRLDDIVLTQPGTIFKTTSGKIQRFLCKKHYQNNDWIKEAST